MRKNGKPCPLEFIEFGDEAKDFRGDLETVGLDHDTQEHTQLVQAEMSPIYTHCRQCYQPRRKSYVSLFPLGYGQRVAARGFISL
jgi:hypothetical protein